MGSVVASSSFTFREKLNLKRKPVELSLQENYVLQASVVQLMHVLAQYDGLNIVYVVVIVYHKNNNPIYTIYVYDYFLLQLIVLLLKCTRDMKREQYSKRVSSNITFCSL